jgi:hypothetical protein
MREGSIEIQRWQDGFNITFSPFDSRASAPSSRHVSKNELFALLISMRVTEDAALDAIRKAEARGSVSIPGVHLSGAERLELGFLAQDEKV